MRAKPINIAKLCELYDEGLSFEEIMEKLDTTEKCLVNSMRHNHLSTLETTGYLSESFKERFTYEWNRATKRLRKNE